MAGYSLRPATNTDVDAIYSVYVSSRRLLLPYAPTRHPEGLLRLWIGSKLIVHSKTTVAESDERIDGFFSISSDARIDWLDQLYVRAECVGGGLGKLLMSSALTVTRRPLRLYTFQQNERARRFYERHGFRAIEFSDGSNNEEKCPDVLYELT